MSAIKLVIGLGSLLLGANQIRKGVRHLGEATQSKSRTPRMTARQRAHMQAVIRQRQQAGRRGGLASIDAPEAVTYGKMTKHQVKTLEDRIKHIRQRVEKGMLDPKVYTFAREVVNAKCGDNWCVPEKDNLAEMKALFDAVRKNVRYTSDILNVDTYQNPDRTLGLRGGDCDDYSSLMCALLLSIGIPCRFKVIRTKDASEWNHIYVQGGLPRAAPQKWYTLDASVAKPFGWEAPASMIAESRIFSAR